MEQIPSRKANISTATQEISRHFMDPEDSLPPLQDPAACPYTESYQSTLRPHNEHL